LCLVGLCRLSRRNKPTFVVALAWLVLPFAITAAYAQIGSSMYAPRYFCFVVPAMALLIAGGLETLRERWQAVVVTLLILFGDPRLSVTADGLRQTGCQLPPKC